MHLDKFFSQLDCQGYSGHFMYTSINPSIVWSKVMDYNDLFPKGKGKGKHIDE